MPPEKTITSTNNPHIKNVLRLREKKSRDSQNLMIIDGDRATSVALNNAVLIKELYYCEDFFKSSDGKNLVERVKKKGAQIFHLNSKVFTKIAYGDNPEGIISIAAKIKRSLTDLPKAKSGLYLVLESVEKPGNLGAILRTADATRVDAVIVCDAQTDIYNPNVIRSSLGAFFTVPVVAASSRETLQWLKGNQMQIVASTPYAQLEYTEVDFRKSSAVVLGSENQGLSAFWMNAGDIKIKIPLQGQADSLNVSTAAAVILYEIVRQRVKDKK